MYLYPYLLHLYASCGDYLALDLSAFDRRSDLSDLISNLEDAELVYQANGDLRGELTRARRSIKALSFAVLGMNLVLGIFAAYLYFRPLLLIPQVGNGVPQGQLKYGKQ